MNFKTKAGYHLKSTNKIKVGCPNPPRVDPDGYCELQNIIILQKTPFGPATLPMSR